MVKQYENIDDLIRFQQSLIVSARNTVDTFDRKLHEIKAGRLDLDKRERELKRSFAESQPTIDRANKEIARLQQLKSSQVKGMLGPRNMRQKTQTERQLARREALLRQLAKINDELGLVNGDEVK